MSTLMRAIAVALLAWGMAAVSLAQDNVGVRVNSDGALDGYTLVAPLDNSEAYLIDNDGRVVAEWDFGALTGEIHLLDNGNLLAVRSANVELDKSLIELGYDGNGAIAEYSWDGEMVWEYNFLDPARRHHHGIDILPNGNILALVWDYHHIDEALARGLDPEIAATLFDELESFLPDSVVEINRESSEIVWEWRAWDHLVQDLDQSLPNFGSPSAHLGRLDINYHQYLAKGIPANWSAGPHDWLHSNMVNYNPDLDQIIISVLRFDELWILDHRVSVEDAAGRAGDLLYRWGNPFAYGHGDMREDRRLYQQHDVQWIADGLPGAGNILVFNNRNNVIREHEPAEDEYSSILELKLPLQSDGSYDWTKDAEIVWQYESGFYSQIISGVQRLPNGNTLITDGVPGRLIEVTVAGDVVWEYVLPLDMERKWLFRARKYAADHPGLAGKDLTPGDILGV